MNRLVSIIIPLYNSAAFIGKTLEAVFKTTYSPIEVILVDDGSGDATREAIEAGGWLEKVHYIYQDNKGISGARNTGILAAKGHYLSLLDHDDLPLPEKIEVLVRYLEKNPQFSMVYTPVRMEGAHMSEKAPSRQEWVTKYEGDLSETLFVRSHISPSSTLFIRQSIIDAGLFDETFKINEDMEFFFRYSLNHMIGYIDKPLTIYSWRYDNTSVRWSRMIPDFEIKLYEKYYPVIRDRFPNARKIYRRGLGNSYRNKAKIEMKDGDFGASFKYCVKAIKLQPLRLKNYERFVKICAGFVKKALKA